MSEEKHMISRRTFLKDAGLLVGGVGTAAVLAGCGDNQSTNTSTKVDGKGNYICPIDEQKFKSLDELKAHFSKEHSGATLDGLIELKVNGESAWLKVEPRWTLNFVLREILGLYGTKRACEHGECGMCTVLMDGRPIMSCMTLACEAAGHEITTIEGITPKDGSLSKVQQAFVDCDATQCGFCTPAQIVVAEALLKKNPKPTDDEIKEFMGGTLCRCGVYAQMQKAVKSLAK